MTFQYSSPLYRNSAYITNTSIRIWIYVALSGLNLMLQYHAGVMSL